MAHPPIANLVAHFKSNENAANTTVADSSPSEFSTVWSRNTDNDSVAGKINTALRYNKANKATVSCGTGLSFTDDTSDKPVSIALWVWMDAISSSDHFITKLNGAGSYEWNIGSNWGLPQCFFRDVSTGIWVGVKGDTALDTGKWVHVVFTYNGVPPPRYNSTGLSIYVDSVKQTAGATRPAGTYDCMESTAGDLSIGTWYDAVANMDGNMDDIRIYNIELTQAQIDSIYNSGDGTEDEGDGEAAHNVLFFSCNF